jgi:hypothetical protein
MAIVMILVVFKDEASILIITLNTSFSTAAPTHTHIVKPPHHTCPKFVVCTAPIMEKAFLF